MSILSIAVRGASYGALGMVALIAASDGELSAAIDPAATYGAENHYRPLVSFHGSAARFALVATIAADGRRDLFTVDYDLTAEDCAAGLADPIAAAADLGVAIRLQTAARVESVVLSCVLESRA